jgi:hypothetical protein
MDEATRLIESGYRSVSNRHRMVSRIDRPDWREHMARDHHRGFRGDPQRNLEEGMRWVRALGTGAADHYRRVLSKDTVTMLPQDVFDAVRKAGAGFGWGGVDEYREIVPGP